MLHPDIELKKISDEIGYGVFATRRIPAGTITWVLDPLDQIIDARWAENVGGRAGELIERYTWINSRGDRVLCWDFARFMNHSCEANTFGAGGLDVDIAVCDIDAGQEVTCDYGTLNLDEPFRCLCGTRRCRESVTPRDLDDFAAGWDKRVRAAFPRVRQVEQALRRWAEVHERTIEQWAQRPDTIPSLRTGRWAPPETITAAITRKSR